MNTLLVVDIVALALFAWACAFKIVPLCATNICRYRLWQIRDGLVDAIRADAFEDSQQPNRVVDVIEETTRSLSDLSAFNLLLFYLSSRSLSKGRLWRGAWKLDEMQPRDRERLKHHVDAFEQAVISHVFLGTPSGWLALAVVAPMALAEEFVKRLKLKRKDGDRTPLVHASLVRDARRHVREEFDMDPALALACAPTTNSHRRQSVFQGIQ
jgi:hypothetical protein